MNKKFKTLMTVTLASLMFCGTALDAPRGGRGRAPKQAPRHHAPKHHAPRHHHGHKHHGHLHKNAGWITLGATSCKNIVR